MSTPPPPLVYGEVAVGGGYHYAEMLDPDGTTIVLFVEQFDDIERHMRYVMGETFAELDPRDFYTALTPDRAQDNTPHDICAFPDNSGLLVAVVPSLGVLELRKYEIGTDDPPSILQTWTDLDTDFGWAREQVRIDIACDSKTVYYTDCMRTIFRFDLETGLQLDPYLVLDEDSPYLCGAIKVLSPGQAQRTNLGDPEDGPVVIVARTKSGTGAQKAMCLDSDVMRFWTDEVNPEGDVFRALKRKLTDGSSVLEVPDQLNPEGVNDEVTALACLVNKCLLPQVPGIAKYSKTGATFVFFKTTVPA